MAGDSAISKYAVLSTKSFNVKTTNGSEESIKIELGDHSIFPLRYAEGKAPVSQDEIALSVMNAEELGKKSRGSHDTVNRWEGEKPHRIWNLF